jgi:hypothetical protein
MALTISVGLVVDDAIVMLENITRYVEDGEAPFAAALKGSREIAFTIASISISLIAVLIPLLLMGGIVGRLFREFAVTLSMTIGVSAAVSLTLTPMMASRFLVASRDTRHGRLYALSERGFAALLKSYERCLDVALKFRLVTLGIFFAFLALSVYLFVVIPKGFFPQHARLRHCGRPPREPGPDAVHDAGHLYLSRSVVGLDIKLANANVESAASTASLAVPITVPAARQCDLGRLRLLRRFTGLIRIFVNLGRAHLTAARSKAGTTASAL